MKSATKASYRMSTKRSSYQRRLTAAIIGVLLLQTAALATSADECANPTQPGGDTTGTCKNAPGDAIFQQSLNEWKGTMVDHVPYDEMTHDRFFAEYQVKRKPVVIKGIYASSPLTEGINDEEWGWQAMRDRFGHVELENRVTSNVSKKGCTGTGLCEGEPIQLRDLIDQYFLNENSGNGSGKREKKNSPYPHDIELKKFLPSMFEIYQKPSLIAENLLLPIKNGKDRWPSLFFGAKGTQTNLHVDSMGTTFTMAVFRGRKQFLMFDAKDGPKLCMENPSIGLDYGVGLDPFKPDFIHCPEAATANALFADVGPGDLLFMPGHIHHAARNLVHSVGISQNLFTVTDYDAMMEDFGGYVTNIKKRRSKTGEKFNVGMDFLSTRDLFRLLAETNFRSNWRNDKPFWNAEEASNESYKRIKSHLTKVVKENASKYAPRPAYFCNYELLIIALKEYGVWSCLNETGRETLLAQVSYAPHSKNKSKSKPEMMTLIDSTLKRNANISNPLCSPIIEKYMSDVLDVEVQKAVSTLGGESGLTKYCC